MASLLHRDRDGVPLVGRAGRGPPGCAAEEWVATYLRAYLRPLVHCLLAYDLAFMPHGENLVMVLRDHVPTRMVMKDIGEEVAVLADRPLPAEVERIRADVHARRARAGDPHRRLRRLPAPPRRRSSTRPALLRDHAFWDLVARLHRRPRRRPPGARPRRRAYDLLRAEFAHSCLNRLQLRNTLQMVDLADQAESLIFAGTLRQPDCAVERR